MARPKKEEKTELEVAASSNFDGRMISMKAGFAFYLVQHEPYQITKTLEDFQKELCESYHLYCDGLKSSKEDYIEVKAKQLYDSYIQRRNCARSIEKICIHGNMEQILTQLKEVEKSTNFVGFITNVYNPEITYNTEQYMKFLIKKDII